MYDPYDRYDCEFRCGACGVRAPSAAVAYDSLGYAVCPDCDATTRPTDMSLDDGEWIWNGDVAERPSD